MIGFYILVSLIGVVCILVPVSPNRSPARKRLPAPTRDHQPRLLALVERVEAYEADAHRRESGCGLSYCVEHNPFRTAEKRKAALHRITARAHELGIEPGKLRKAP